MGTCSICDFIGSRNSKEILWFSDKPIQVASFVHPDESLYTGRCIVVPEEHVEKIRDFKDTKAYVSVVETASILQHAIEIAFNPDSFYILYNQDQGHFHLDVIPIYKNQVHGLDPDILNQPFNSNPMPAKLQEQLQERIAKAIEEILG